MKKTLPFLLSALLLLPATMDGQTTYYVAKTGSNSNPGTSALAPKKNIDKAIQVAGSGDTIKIAGGSYSGTFNVGYFVLDESISLVGSYDSSFSTQSILLHPTVIAPDNASAASGREPLLSFSGGPIDNVTIDGIVFDRGEQNSYSTTDGIPPGWTGTGRLLIPPSKAPGDNATVTEPILQIPSSVVASNIAIRNCVFANGASFGIQAGIRSGIFLVRNNIFINNRFGAVEAYGTCATGPCVNVEFSYNTVLLSTTRGYDLAADDLGIGYRIRTKATHHIHHNIFAGNNSALEHTFFVPDGDIQITDNYIAASNVADMRYNPSSGNALNLRGEQLNDLDATVTGNVYAVPAGLMMDADHLDALLRSFLKDGSAPPDGSYNQWRQYHGLPALAGGETFDHHFHANRYPQDDAIGLFGAVSGFGAALFGGDAAPSIEYAITSLTRTPSGIILTWPVVAGWTRDVQYTESLDPPSWSTIISGLSTGFYSDTNSTRVSRPGGFYRCIVHP
jgi:hypothetical protein